MHKQAKLLNYRFKEATPAASLLRRITDACKAHRAMCLGNEQSHTLLTAVRNFEALNRKTLHIGKKFSDEIYQKIERNCNTGIGVKNIMPNEISKIMMNVTGNLSIKSIDINLLLKEIIPNISNDILMEIFADFGVDIALDLGIDVGILISGWIGSAAILFCDGGAMGMAATAASTANKVRKVANTTYGITSLAINASILLEIIFAKMINGLIKYCPSDISAPICLGIVLPIVAIVTNNPLIDRPYSLRENLLFAISMYIKDTINLSTDVNHLKYLGINEPTNFIQKINEMSELYRKLRCNRDQSFKINQVKAKPNSDVYNNIKIKKLAEKKDEDIILERDELNIVFNDISKDIIPYLASYMIILAKRQAQQFIKSKVSEVTNNITDSIAELSNINENIQEALDKASKNVDKVINISSVTDVNSYRKLAQAGVLPKSLDDTSNSIKQSLKINNKQDFKDHRLNWLIDSCRLDTKYGIKSINEIFDRLVVEKDNLKKKIEPFRDEKYKNFITSGDKQLNQLRQVRNNAFTCNWRTLNEHSVAHIATIFYQCFNNDVKKSYDAYIKSQPKIFVGS